MRNYTITPLDELIRLKNAGAFGIYNHAVEGHNESQRRAGGDLVLTLDAMPLVEVTLNGVYYRADGTPLAYGVAGYLLDSNPDSETEKFFNARFAMKASEPDMVVDLGWIRVGSLEHDPTKPKNETSHKVHLVYESDVEQFLRLTTTKQGHLSLVKKE